MAKYCMFCGEELPSSAQFCISCGQRQDSVSVESSSKQNKNNSGIDDEDDEMDLLLKYGMMSGSKKQTTTQKKEEPKIIKLDYQPEIIEEIKKPQNVIETIKEEKEDTFEEIKEDLIKEEITIEEPIYPTTEPEIESEPPIDEPYLEAPQETSEVVEEPTPEKIPKNKVTLIDDTWDDDDDDWDDGFSNDESEQKDIDIKAELLKNSMEQNQIDEKEKAEELENKPVSRHSVRRRDVSIKKRSISTEEEEESFSTSLNESNNSMFESSKLLADERADYEKRKNAKIEDDESLDDRSQLEGRRQQTQKVEKRRKSQRNYNEKSFYKIEHDKSQMDENEDPDYDGYYENVLPIDHDQERKKKVDVKAVLLILLLIVGCIGLIYFTLMKL